MKSKSIVNYLESLPKGALYITSSPSSASIYLDNIYRGYTPKDIKELIEGNYDLRLTKYGYQDYKSILQIEQGKTTKLSLILQPLYFHHLLHLLLQARVPY
ncbi:PEGA domain-containing protein [Candidatus Pacearchaeota archaeon]|nr:PEGA domain-containing protein [Candidatus Pacearchaeota archaeon]